MIYSVKINKRQNQKTPLILRNLGIGHEQDPIHRPKGFPAWQIFYCVSGSGEYLLDGVRGVLSPGQIALLYPAESHRYRSLGGKWQVHFIAFDGQICQKLLTSLGFTHSGFFSLSAQDPFLRHLSILEKQMKEKAPGCITACSVELYTLLLELASEVKRLPDSRITESESLGREIILYLEEHYAEDLSLNDLAEQFHRTPEYLCGKFKADTGETMMQYLRRIRIHNAKVLLLTTPDTGIRDVAVRCGFQSTSYFCKVFREATGQTPQSFRIGAL